MKCVGLSSTVTAPRRDPRHVSAIFQQARGAAKAGGRAPFVTLTSAMVLSLAIKGRRSYQRHRRWLRLRRRGWRSCSWAVVTSSLPEWQAERRLSIARLNVQSAVAASTRCTLALVWSELQQRRGSLPFKLRALLFDRGMLSNYKTRLDLYKTNSE